MIRRTGQDQEDVLGSGGWNMGRVEWTARWKRDLMDSVWTGGLCRRQTTAVSLEIRVFSNDGRAGDRPRHAGDCCVVRVLRYRLSVLRELQWSS